MFDNDDAQRNVEMELLDQAPKVENAKPRPVWSRKVEYMLSLIGYTIGLGVVWRFPYLCMRNGGGAFLIPYIFFMVLCGYPLYVLEVAIGQFSGKSPLVIWCICPLLKGIGYCSIFIAVVFTWYYGLVMAWILCYLFYSFYPTHPWSTCDNPWNSPNCISYRTRDVSISNGTSLTNDSLKVQNSSYINKTTSYYPTAANEFWRFCILNESKGLDDWGTIQWHLVLALFIGFTTMFLCIIKGVKSVGKVAYVSAVAPYILIIIILIKSLTLEGSLDGVVLFLKPDFSKLLHFQIDLLLREGGLTKVVSSITPVVLTDEHIETKVWVEAGLQVFYSLGPAWGSVITMASYNKFHNKCFRDAAIVSFMDLFSALLCGLVVFSIIGFIANEAGMGITEVADAGPGLVFQAYPEALARLPMPQLWAVLFFVMLFLVGLDTQFAMLETFISGLVDLYPVKLGKRKTRLILLVFTGYMTSSLIFATQAGVYIFQLIDWYSSIFIVFLTSFLECVIMGYLYGAERFSRDVEMMIGRPLPTFFRISFCIITPIAMLMGLIATILNYQHPTYKGYVYPNYVGVVGILIALVSVVPVPVLAVYQLLLSRGSFLQRIKYLIKPSNAWGPNDETVAQEYKMYSYSGNLWTNLKCNLFGKDR